MGKYFVRLLLLVAAIVGILLLFEQLLPRGYDFQRSVEIDRPAAEVFPYLNSLEKWPQWSQQFNLQHIEEIKYGGEDEGVNAALTWTEIRGTGKLWITESKPNEALAYESEFQGFPKMSSTFTLDEESENTTVVTWRSTGQLPRAPLYGLMNAISVYETHMEYQYEESLAALKELVEE